MAPRPMPSSAAPPLIPEYFAGREVFITGATGFMGKVLVERLLWTCRDVGRLHLLLRDKQDATPESRLQLLKQSQVFDVIREHCPEQLEKLNAVPGDVTKPQLGLDSISQLNQVSVVFHSAATVRFDEPIAAALNQNVLSAERLLDICDQLPNMQVLVHVSTAFVAPELRAVAERVLPPPHALPHARALVDVLPADLLAEITPQLISPKPNTYTYTKALAEMQVAERAPTAHYAIAIFRPTIVTSSLRTPFPGWIENMNGTSGVLVGVGKGALHVLNCAGHCRADMMPVDICIDTLIAVAWEAAIDDARGSARVYTCSSQARPTTWARFRDDLVRAARRRPLDRVLSYPFGLLIENSVIYKIVELSLQTIPLRLQHAVVSVCGIKLRPSLKTVSQRLQAMNAALQFFARRQWDFEEERVRRLRERLAPADASVFNLDPGTIDWTAHCEDFMRGARRYLLREKDDDMEGARRRMYKLQILHYAAILFLTYLASRLAMRVTPAILRAVAALTRLGT